MYTIFENQCTVSNGFYEWIKEMLICQQGPIIPFPTVLIRIPKWLRTNPEKSTQLFTCLVHPDVTSFTVGQ